MNRVIVRSAAVLCMFLLLACAQSAEVPGPEPLIPETPDGTVRAVADHLAEHDPGILWEALPESYRADIDDLTARFAAVMDPELYDRSMALVRNAIEVLQDKQPLILGSDTVAATGADLAQMERGMTSALAAAHMLFSSQIATLEGLAAMDWKQFLDTTGAQLMQVADSAALAEEPVQNDPFAMLRSLQVETLSTTEGSAVLRITTADGTAEDVELTLVEGRWVPTDLAARWTENVAEARARLDELTPERIAEIKPQAMMGLAMAEGIVAQVATIQTSEEFDAAVGPMLQAVMANAAMLPGAMGEPEPAE